MFEPYYQDGHMGVLTTKSMSLLMNVFSFAYTNNKQNFIGRPKARTWIVLSLSRLCLPH